MAFEGGPLSVVGITPAFVTQLTTQTAASGVSQALGQVWRGSGQSFFGSAGQSLGGMLAGSAVNVAINSVLGTQIAGPGGLTLTSGSNLLASTLTPYVTGAVAAGINQNIQQALNSAGPFGTVLSGLGTGLVNQAFGGIASSILGNAVSAKNYKMFPGSDGNEPEADYGGSAFTTLSDVVFSLQPANQGPQKEALSQAENTPTSATTIAKGQYIQMPTKAANEAVNALKSVFMGAPGSERLISSLRFK